MTAILLVVGMVWLLGTVVELYYTWVVGRGQSLAYKAGSTIVNLIWPLALTAALIFTLALSLPKYWSR